MKKSLLLLLLLPLVAFAQTPYFTGCVFDDEDYEPKKYRFDEEIPVSIFGGVCRIDFSRVKIQELSGNNR